MLRSAPWVSRGPVVALALFALACSGDDATGEFQPTHHAGIEGRVTDSLGAPLAGVRLTGLSDLSGFSYADTKADGTYRIVFGPHMGDTIDRPDDTVTVTLYASPAKGPHRDSTLATAPALLTFHPVGVPLVYVHLDLVALPLP